MTKTPKQFSNRFLPYKVFFLFSFILSIIGTIFLPIDTYGTKNPEPGKDLAASILDIENNVILDLRTNEFMSIIDNIASTLKKRIREETDPRRKIAIMNTYIFEELNYRLDKSKDSDKYFENILLSHILKTHKGRCLNLAILYLVVGERLGLPLHGVIVPDHFFVRFDDGNTRINIETSLKGIETRDDLYLNRIKRLMPAKKIVFYLENLDREQVIGCFLNDLGRHYLNNSELDKSIDVLNESCRRIPLYHKVYFNLGWAYYLKGMYENAVRNYIHSLSIMPNDADSHSMLSLAYLSLGKNGLAEKSARKGSRLNPKSAKNSYILGIVLKDNKKIKEAVRELRRCILLEPRHEEGRFQLAVSLFELGIYDEALKHAQTLKKIASSREIDELIEKIRNKIRVER